MAFKKGLHEIKVKALQESITLKDVDIVAKKYGISKKTGRYFRPLTLFL